LIKETAVLSNIFLLTITISFEIIQLFNGKFIKVLPVLVLQTPLPEQLFGHSMIPSVKLQASPTNPTPQTQVPFIISNFYVGIFRNYLW